jgi:quinolinate synthase
LASLSAEIRSLASQRDAVVIAHNYQRAEVQDVADFTGDSLGLSRQAAQTDVSARRGAARGFRFADPFDAASAPWG